VRRVPSPSGAKSPTRYSASPAAKATAPVAVAGHAASGAVKPPTFGETRHPVAEVQDHRRPLGRRQSGYRPPERRSCVPSADSQKRPNS
jgi:hypothetical protein